MTATVDSPAPGKADRVYAQLRADIETGVFKPGQAIPENELVAYTGASRTPVREAVRRLAAEGLIDLEPRRAPAVSRISIRSARALFAYRSLLESAAIQMVAARASAPGPLRESVEVLERDFAQLRGTDYSEEFQAEFRRLTGQFDEVLAANTPNEYLSRSIIELRPHSRRLRLIAHADVARLQESIAEHLRMCRAILDGDTDQAAAAMTEHLSHVSDSIFRQLVDGDSDIQMS